VTAEIDQRVVAFARTVGSDPAPTLASPICQPCTPEQIDEPIFLKWCDRLKTEPGPHRKLWEWVYICEVLERHGETLGRPMRLLGFGVGREPIVGWFASQGHTIVATDLPAEEADAAFWSDSDQHADSVDRLDMAGLCPPEILRRQVTFLPVDMRRVPDDLGRFDGLWSSCAFEHLGDLGAGVSFVLGTLANVRPGGVAVHTTEFNVSSESDTVAEGPVVLYRRRDLEELRERAASVGFDSDATYSLGADPELALVDHPPYAVPHLKILNGGHVTTSFGLRLTNTNHRFRVVNRSRRVLRRVLGR
jgi:hypothetical protein